MAETDYSKGGILDILPGKTLKIDKSERNLYFLSENSAVTILTDFRQKGYRREMVFSLDEDNHIIEFVPIGAKFMLVGSKNGTVCLVSLDFQGNHEILSQMNLNNHRSDDKRNRLLISSIKIDLSLTWAVVNTYTGFVQRKIHSVFLIKISKSGKMILTCMKRFPDKVPLKSWFMDSSLLFRMSHLPFMFTYQSSPLNYFRIYNFKYNAKSALSPEDQFSKIVNMHHFLSIPIQIVKLSHIEEYNGKLWMIDYNGKIVIVDFLFDSEDVKNMSDKEIKRVNLEFGVDVGDEPDELKNGKEIMMKMGKEGDRNGRTLEFVKNALEYSLDFKVNLAENGIFVFLIVV